MKEEPGNNYSRIVIFILALFTAALRLYVSDNLEYHEMNFCICHSGFIRLPGMPPLHP